MRRESAFVAIALLTAATAALCGDDGGAKQPPAPAAEDDDIPTEDLRAGGNDRMRYFLNGPKKGAKEPKGGWKLLYVLPGGDGGENFKGFVKNMYRQAWSDEYLEVQLVSTKWTPEQVIVWPTAANPAKDQGFSTEEFFAAVHKDVSAKRTVDAKGVFALGWSSGGPPVYTLALQPKSPVRGAYVAMSVFKPRDLPKLGGAKGKPFFIDHSPDDKTCPFRMAEEARDALKAAGAEVEFVTYDGGHGWKGAIWDRLKKGAAHLEKFAK